MTTQRTRICIIAPEFIGPFPNGGVGTACFWEATALAAANFDVTVLYTGPTDRETADHWERTYGAGAFAYVDLWKWAAAGDADAVNRVQHPCAEARTSELVYRFLRRQRFDLLLFQEFLGHAARTLQARRSGEALADVTAAVTLHSCRQWIYEGMQRMPSSLDDLSVDFLERESGRLADYVIAPSRHMAEWAAAHWKLPSSAVVVPYCYDGTTERPATSVRHQGPFTQLVFFGRLETRKGLHLFCRALANSDEALGPVRKVTFLGKTSTVEGRPSEEFIRRTLSAPMIDLQIGIIDTLGSLEALQWLERQRDALVVAPSLVDNLPYAVIELFTRRIPFISTRIGGIPEIVGSANAHALAEPSVAGLADVLGRAHRDGLTVDYRHGYSSSAATAAHLECVRSMLQHQPLVRQTHDETCDVVFVDADSGQGNEAQALGAAFLAADPSAAGARFFTLNEWRQTHTPRQAIFTSASVTPCAGMVRRLLATFADPRVESATSYYIARDASGCTEVAPLGASLESGWTRNVFGGPCLVARPSTFSVIRDASRCAFQFWPVYAALACAGRELALIPDVLYAADAGAVGDEPAAVEAVVQAYDERARTRVDLGWILKYARSGAGHAAAGPAVSGGRELYDHLLAIPDSQLEAFSGLSAGPGDPFIDDLRKLRRRLSALVSRWQTTSPRVLVYGAGQHAKLVLALEPELGRFIGGFIDRRPISQFLGRPCIRPEDVSPATADAILYSSREFERDMHARLAAVAVEHVLLYSDSPQPAAPSTARRMRARLGHSGAPVEALRAMYRPPKWATGFISGGDAEFLLELVSGVNPRSVLELGVASGMSSSALLFALDHLYPASVERVLQSCDVRASCYFDETRPTGHAVSEMFAEHRARWVLDTDTDARRLSLSLTPGSVDLTFIDANHSHPWPLLDLLHVTRIVRPGSWIALHDIELPNLNPKYQVWGPNWLFHAWPFNKVHGVDGSVNIGAVQLPEDLRSLVPMALALLARPWEHAPSAWDVDLPEVFQEVTDALTPRLKGAAQLAAAG